MLKRYSLCRTGVKPCPAVPGRLSNSRIAPLAFCPNPVCDARTDGDAVQRPQGAMPPFFVTSRPVKAGETENEMAEPELSNTGGIKPNDREIPASRGNRRVVPWPCGPCRTRVGWPCQRDLLAGAVDHEPLPVRRHQGDRGSQPRDRTARALQRKGRHGPLPGR